MPVALDLAEAALDGSSPSGRRGSRVRRRRMSFAVGLWWSEGGETIVSWRESVLQMELLHGPEGRRLSYFTPLDADRWRYVRGRERGELLRVVRGEDGAVMKL